MGIFARPLGLLLYWIYKLVGNYGISLIILTVLVKVALYPLYRKQIKSTANMSEMAEKQKEIQARYANDREKMNQAMSELYAKEGFNPMSGCLPMLIQFPIIMGLYELLRNPLVHMTSPAMLAAVHESFLWVPDLSQPDSWILPILAGLTTFLQTYFSTKGQDQSTAGAMKGMTYFMPLMIFLLGRSFASGLALYWVIGNLVMIAQTVIMNKMKAKKNLQKQAQAEIEKRQKQANK